MSSIQNSDSLGLEARPYAAADERKVCFSDNNAAIHPQVMQTVLEVNRFISRSGLPAYGEDCITHQAEDILRGIFGAGSSAFFVPTGTGANVLALAALGGSSAAVIASDIAHVCVDEGNALQSFCGSSVIPLESFQGKITAAQVRDGTRDKHGVGWYHKADQRVVTISQPTEIGTLYTPEEIADIADAAHCAGL